MVLLGQQNACSTHDKMILTARDRFELEINLRVTKCDDVPARSALRLNECSMLFLLFVDGFKNIAIDPA